MKTSDILKVLKIAPTIFGWFSTNYEHKRTSSECDFFVYRIYYKDPSQTVPSTPLVRLLEMLCNDMETARIGFL